MQKEDVLRRIAEALGREKGATSAATKRDVAQRGEGYGNVVKVLEAVPVLAGLGTTLSRPGTDAFETDVIRRAGALAVDITIEWADEYWKPENEQNVTAEDLNALEAMIRTTFVKPGDEIPGKGYSDEVVEALQGIYAEIAEHYQTVPVGESGTDRVLATIAALRTELGRTNN
jgi:hypothetical protein